MDDVEQVERAMIAIRRRQTRRALGTDAAPTGQAFDVLDVIEASLEPTVSVVATALAVDQPRASKLVGAAVSSGLVRRVADQADGRRSVLMLTEQGEQMLAESHRRRRAAFDAAMGDWTARDRADFARLLTRFVDAMP
ncbi:MarR family winged helix-turn-helix transcriptional regulator [Nocardia sp. NBC_01730]|uniref:MarR family winged helix-turn-helix transcriptional regulator n=1 Tax=Nocardia sp. NBC_01730 TaxID=2975998 RepID=UPI002E14B5C2|nr:MarR family winged helix-turn-helix transcriptional regulator [Nocardia sp. NBC_01730]